MTYQIFARKFRPQTFSDVVGQEPIVTTLSNAIKHSRIPQNFLFSGPRGVGKTSTARILAKALNCEKGPTEKPCGKCNSCKEITQTNAMDVLEIDGASNRGIDEIRGLRETVKFKPVTGRYKIYIIDEVHMLTTEAFNALLKTLEEPPPHVKFVFATTESHKVPLTILSRCHRFNFKRIPTGEIASKLEAIAKQEKLKCEKNALFLIAKASDGALRDGEGLLDQLASFSDKKIKEEDVLLMLGLASEELYFSTLDALSAKDAGKIFSLVSELYDGGRDLVQFAKGLLEIFRSLLLFQSTSEADEFVEMSEEGLKGLASRKDVFSRGELLLALSLLGNLQMQLRRNIASPKLLVETMLLKLLNLDGFQTVAAVPSIAPQTKPTRTGGGGFRPQSSAPAPTAPQASTKLPSEVNQPRESGNSQPAGVNVAEATLNSVSSIWPKVIEYVKVRRMSTGIFLSESEPVEVDGLRITLALPTEFQFHKEMLEKEANRRVIEEAFKVVGGQEFRVQFVVTEVEKKEQAAGRATNESSGGKSDIPEIVTEAMNIFEGSKIVRAD